MNFDLRSHTILLTVAGSRAYGIHLPTSDVDVKGIAIPPKSILLGLSKFEQTDSPDHIARFSDLLTAEETQAMVGTKLEGTVFDLRKFMCLAAESNPNIWDVLFCRDEDVRLQTKLGALLRDNRDLFLSAKARFSFAGYAHAQLKRIKGHRAFLLNPPKNNPTRADFGLPEQTLLPKDQLAAAEAMIRKKMDSWAFNFSGLPGTTIIEVENQITSFVSEIAVALGYSEGPETQWLAAARTVGLSDNLIFVLQKEREYEAAKRRWKQYHEWKANRNPARFAMEEKYGFDCKHAGHLVRLLTMSKEIMLTGKVHVWRGAGGPDDAAEIREVREGAWSYDQVIEWSAGMETELDRIYKSGEYALQKTPDATALNDLSVLLLETFLNEGIR